jgi:hypothetical protein
VIRPEALEFPPLNYGLGPTLGDYYQDFHGAIAMVESGYHGPIDSRGVPLVTIAGQGAFTNPVTTAQYALANMTAVRRGELDRNERAQVQLDWLVDAQEQQGNWTGCWLMRHDDQKYAWLRAPWTGSLTSGHAISALLRGHELFGAAEYRDSAQAAYEALHAEREPLTLFSRSGEDLWYEEYPAPSPLHVLNGHLYTALAVLDYARVTEDGEAYDRWRSAASTALRHLAEFDVGYWSIYDLRFRERANVHYHKNIHIPLLRIMAALTGENGFSERAERWERYLRSRWSHARLAMSLRVRARLAR